MEKNSSYPRYIFKHTVRGGRYTHALDTARGEPSAGEGPLLSPRDGSLPCWILLKWEGGSEQGSHDDPREHLG